MSSVLVKGMEMPENCYECPMVHREFDGYETRLDCYMVKDWCPEDEGVHPDCPLVVLPDKHGRLVDADALIIDLMDRGLDGIQTDDWAEIQQTVMKQPTIVESEGK